ncbi:Dipeptidase 2 [Merluccius polli]|uniref:Dipeptidase n=1 Tax=Merluccius polli TaxID=89951 RepID=A0AA47M965_MERPO|nr:Dipeptidase 2 [Merluccius polli]
MNRGAAAAAEDPKCLYTAMSPPCPCVPRCVLVRLAILSSLCGLLAGDSERDRVHELMSRHPVIDGHNDLAIQLRVHSNNLLSRVDLHNLPSVATDITRLRAGHVQTQVFAAYVLCGAQDKDAVRLTLEQVDVLRRVCTEYKDLELGCGARRRRGPIACVLSVEGGHSIDSSLPALRMFYQLGVRSMALTHNCNTPWAASSSSLYDYYPRENNSLTSFGRAVVTEMNRLGMIVDLSHSSWDTARTAIHVSKAPVIFSHSSAHAVCNHNRNVPDWLLHELKKKGGLIMVNLFSDFVACKGEATVSAVADHFDHIRKTIGAESIGIGGDYDGVHRNCCRRKWSEQEVAGVLRHNFLRVFDEVERVMKRRWLQEEVKNPCRLVLHQPTQAHRVKGRSSSAGSLRPPHLLWTLLLLLLLPGLLALY